MAFNGLQTGILARSVALAATLAVLGWMVSTTAWYITIALMLAVATVQVFALVRHASRSGREIARFLDAIAFEDNTISFSSLAADGTFRDLGTAMGRVLDRLRSSRVEREEQAQYLQSLLAHVPVALISLDERGKVQLLNLAARRLFASACNRTAEFLRYGPAFAAGLESLKPGESLIVRMERPMGALQLKAAATDVVLNGARHRLVSLQNIETELTAQELAAWQTVIRVMAHEVINSLTPISSLAATARQRVDEVQARLPPESPDRADLADASEALETLARRSEGLLHFVQNHRRLTKRMVAQTEIVPLRRAFSRLQRLLAAELETRNIMLTARAEPDTLEVEADPELLDQALINLVRNAIEALGEQDAGVITLSARQDGGHVVIAVADNGPGIAMDQREKVFVPFFTTKRQGSGVGLTLVRQIATLHGASVSIGDTPGGGTTVSMRF
jgi:nitrogen fixation/metabolism regulation signal transduction histidine kinase